MIFETPEEFFIHDGLDGRVYKIPIIEMQRDGLRVQLQHPLSSYLLDPES